MKRALILIVTGLSATAHATGETKPVEEIELSSLLDLQVSAATKRPTPLSESPAIGAAFTRSQIDDYGWLSLNEIVYSQPGFFAARDFERRTIGSRGETEEWNNNRMLLLIDGMPQNDVETGTAYTWEVTPLFMARSVEVLRAPGSALYGSYAMHGVISIDTLSPADLGGNRALARLRLTPGTLTVDALGALSSRFADVLLAYNRMTTDGDTEDGIDESGRTDDSGNPRRFRLADDRDTSTFFVKAEGRAMLEGLTATFQHQLWHFATGRGWLLYVPDTENMGEQRSITSLRYRTPGEHAWTQEYSLQVQRHSYREDVALYPAGSFDGYYPQAITEHIDTDLTNVFLRAQVTRALPRSASLLAGAEYTGLLYGGDRLHTSNMDLADPDMPPLDADRPLGALYEKMLDHLVSRVGVYGQLASGALLGERLELTVGLRYDNLFFDYTDTDDPIKPTRSRSFQDLSPRLALVARASDSLILKLMAARAFRAPTPVELFITNTWTASPTQIDSLTAERQDTFELAADLRISRALRLRSNVWLASLEGSIGYTADSLAIINRYDNWRAGFETELTFDARLGRRAQIDGWLSWSFAHLLSEKIFDPDLSPQDGITRAPRHTAKAGARLRLGRVTVSGQAIYQGRVQRRDSDLLSEEHLARRDVVLPSWITLDASLHVDVAQWLRAGVVARNLLDSGGKLAAPGDLSFDYAVDDRRVLFELSLEL